MNRRAFLGGLCLLSCGDARANHVWTPQLFGAVADGRYHPLHERFGSLNAAQALYPHASSLEDSIDWAAIQAALHQIAKGGGGQLYLPSGHYVTASWLIVPSNCRITGDGPDTHIENIKREGANNDRSVFHFGNFHPAHFGRRPVGSNDPYSRKVELYRSGSVDLSSTSVGLEQFYDAGSFLVGEIVVVSDRIAINQLSTGEDLQIPINSTVTKIRGTDEESGRIEFVDSVGFFASRTYVARIPPAAQDSFGPISIVDNSHIENLSVKAHSIISNCSAAYDSSIKNVGGVVEWMIQGNSFTKCSFSNFTQKFRRGVVEVKFAASHTIVSDIVGLQEGQRQQSMGLICIGEYCRNISISNFEITADNWSGGPCVQMQPGMDCHIYDGTIRARNSTHIPLMFYADRGRSIENCTVRRVDFHSGSRHGIVFGGEGAFGPVRCGAYQCRFFSENDAGDGIAVTVNGGSQCEVVECLFEKSEAVRISKSKGTRLQGNVFLPQAP